MIAVLSHLPPLPRRIVGVCLAGLVCWRVTGVFFNACGLWNSNLGSPKLPQEFSFVWTVENLWGRSVRLIAIGILPVCGALAWLNPRISRVFERAIRFSLAAFAFCGFWIVPKLIRIVSARPVTAPRMLVSAQARGVPGGRIVWILFDELSDDLVFDHRPPGLALRNFDKLYSKSTSFDNLQPVGMYTDRVVPSLLAGFQITQIAGTLDGRLLYLDRKQHRWVPYEPEQTLFGLAQAKGWNPGVAGWYIPYCRTFAAELSACSWIPGIQVDMPIERDGMSESDSALANALILPEAHLANLVVPSRIVSPGKADTAKLLAQNIRDYLQVMKSAEGLIEDGRIRFVFLHLPVPHPPGFYNRRPEEFQLQ